MKSKKIGIIAGIFVLIAIIGICTFVIADTVVNKEKAVSKLVQTDSSGNELSSASTIFCIKDGIGFEDNAVVHYTNYFNLRNPEEIESTFKAMLPTTDNNYKALVWLFDNISIKGDEQSKIALLQKAGLSADAFKNYTIGTNSQTQIESDIIEVVEQAAIWYFTNPSGEYHPVDVPDFLVDGEDLSTKYSDSSTNPALVLYQYLVQGAKNAASSNYDIKQEGQVRVTSGVATVEKSGDNYIIGPYKIAGQSANISNLTLTAEADGASVTVTNILGASKQEISGSSINDKLKNNLNNNFYVVLPSSVQGKSVKVTVNGTNNFRNLTYWTSDAANVGTTQPIVKTENATETIKLEDTKQVPAEPEPEPEKIYDLHLKEFLYQVNGQTISGQEPSIQSVAQGTDGKITVTYGVTKDTYPVCENDTVIYKLRVYNQGTGDAYAKEITHTIPDGLEFVIGDVNNGVWTMYDENGNVTTDTSKAKYVKTNYLSGTKIDAVNGSDVASYDVPIEFKVKELTTAGKTIELGAQIDKVTKDGTTEVTEIDTNNNKDTAKLYVKYFDLAIAKWAKEITVVENGQTKTLTNDEPENNSKILKIEVDKNRTENAVIRVRYVIRVSNVGEIAGYASEIQDNLPDGLEFVSADNPLWTNSNGKITTNALDSKLIEPGEYEDIEIVLTWKNSGENLGVKKNTAKINSYRNSSNSKDINDKNSNGEGDDSGTEIAILEVSGRAGTIALIVGGVLGIIGLGLFFIRKYVL